MAMEVGLSGVLSVMTFVKDIVTGREKTKADNARDFFDQVIEPSFQKFQCIHDDYIQSMSALVAYLKNEQMPPDELISWLRSAGLEYRSKREQLWTIEEELRGQAFSNLSGLSGRGDVQGVVRQYVRELLEYSHQVHAQARYSFYRSYEQALSSYLKTVGDGMSRAEAAAAFYSHDFVQDTNKSLIYAADELLPRQWKKVATEYRIVRSTIGIG